VQRPQPQLFVAADFEQLDAVLDAVARSFACRLGGRAALQRAQESADDACLELEHGMQLAGTVQAVHGAETVDLVELSGSCAIAQDHAVLKAWPRTKGYVLPLGVLEDGTPLSALGADGLRAHCDDRRRMHLRLKNGIEIRGRVLPDLPAAGRVSMLLLADCSIVRQGHVYLRAGAPYPLLLAERVTTAHAQMPNGFYEATAFRDDRVPMPRTHSLVQRELIELYEQAQAALRASFGAQVVPRFENIHRVLSERHPEEWLLRWNLLESLIKLGEDGVLARSLLAELERLELRFAHREPIATGLAYLRALGVESRARHSHGGPT
jgi:phenylalanine-4-hydroxylase